MLMAQHKWHKEIKAWADGAEIEGQTNHPGYSKKWITYADPLWSSACGMKFRVKKQPKEPKYLYVYARNGEINYIYEDPRGWEGQYIGKIKLESDDGN
jgi:hypothetical protein